MGLLRTRTRLMVLRSFAEFPERELAGADVMRLLELGPGTVYPVLIAFEKQGLLESRWESEQPQVLERPRRRLYRITSLGEEICVKELREIAGAVPLNPRAAER